MSKSKDELRRLTLVALRRNPVAVLATADLKGRPSAAAVFVAWEDDFTAYFLTKTGTRKSYHLSVNPQISLAAGFEPPVYVQMSGRATKIRRTAERAALIERLAKISTTSHLPWPPITRTGRGDYVAYRIRPSRVHVLDLAEYPVSQEHPATVDLI